MEWKISNESVPYEDAVAFMEARVQLIREGNASEMVWLLEHPSLFTAGTSAKDSDLIDTLGFPVYQTGRGGQYTYHGPGQRIAYVMLDLKARKPDVRLYVQQLEQWIISMLKDFDIKGEVRAGRVGVWVQTSDGAEAKIAAIGVRIRSWVTYHGISLNIHPDLSHYRGIIPCGITEFGVTSVKELGIDTTIAEVDKHLIRIFKTIF